MIIIGTGEEKENIKYKEGGQMKCRIHGYEHHRNCKYCTNQTKWVNDDYEITDEDKKLKWCVGKENR